MRILGLLAALVCLGIVTPVSARAGALGIGGEFQATFPGTSDIQWSVVSGTEKTTTALFGKAFFGAAPGAGVYYIHSKNLFFGLSGLYRQMTGEFQIPGGLPNEPVTYKEEMLILRIGYIDYYPQTRWSLDHWQEIIPAYPFGHFRFGFFRSDISGSDAFGEFEPAYAGSLGLEFGALYNGGPFNFIVSGMVDYSFTVTPYTAHYPGRREEILNNLLVFSLATHFGWVSEAPE